MSFRFRHSDLLKIQINANLVRTKIKKKKNFYLSLLNFFKSNFFPNDVVRNIPKEYGIIFKNAAATVGA